MFDKLKRKNFFIKVNKKLVISCGAIESSKLLLKSKIKNKNLGKKFLLSFEWCSGCFIFKR